jgi:hypothetical protein
MGEGGMAGPKSQRRCWRHIEKEEENEEEEKAEE